MDLFCHCRRLNGIILLSICLLLLLLSVNSIPFCHDYHNKINVLLFKIEGYLLVEYPLMPRVYKYLECQFLGLFQDYSVVLSNCVMSMEYADPLFQADLRTKRQRQNANTQYPNTKNALPKPKTQKSVAFHIFAFCPCHYDRISPIHSEVYIHSS